MDTSRADLPLVSALFITYKRFEHLRRAVESFRRNTDYRSLEIVIADDGSGPEIQERIRSLPADRFALAETNCGLGANNNAGVRLCSGKYVLMIQDDWVCRGPAEYLRNAVLVMEANPDVGVINFAGAGNPPDLKQPLSGSSEPCYVTPHPGEVEGNGYLYSDQPHLQSMESLRFVGPYREKAADDVSRSEVYYARLWEAQTKYSTAVFPAYHLKTFQFDETAGSFRLTTFKNRNVAALLPIAQWLKRFCWPVYWLGRAAFYSVVRLLELAHLVR
ncbi:MAG: glycosyltransferase family 2 protein [Acidobacteriaceae bacterium]